MNSGNPDSKGIIKEKTEGSVMQERIGFVDSDSRKQFFLAVREASSVPSWDALAKLFHVYRSQFQGYQYGKTLLPEKLFNSMLAFLPKEKQEYFTPLIFKKPANWGMIKGGFATYKKHPEIFEAGRKYLTKNRIRTSKNFEEINKKILLSPELCEFIGAFIGDDFVYCYKNRHFLVGMVGDQRLDKEYLENRIPFLVNHFCNLAPHFYKRKNSNAYNLNFNSKQLYKLLTERFGFPKGVKTYTVKIPDEIMASGEKFIFATIRGIFDTDGNVFIDKRKIYAKQYGRITLRTTSQPLHDQLKEFLKNYFSFYSSVIKTEHAPTRQIAIYRQEQIEKWMQLIGFSNQRHLSKIEKLLKPLEGIEPSTCALQKRCSTVEPQRPNLTV